MINHPPKKGQIFMCDFSGFKIPEMIKKRPVIILTSRTEGRPGLVTIVPLSSKKPKKIMAWHHKLDNKFLPDGKFFKIDSWVKADMIYSVSIERLELIQLKPKEGKRQYFLNRIPKDIFNDIMKCVLSALEVKL